MPAFWAWFVAAGTIAFVVWCVWLIYWAGKQGPQNKEDEDLVGHVWDGDLEEWNNPAPKWWLYLYFMTIAWAVGYMVVYPGIGAFDGLLDWSQQGQYEEEMQAAEARYAPIYEAFAEMECPVGRERLLLPELHPGELPIHRSIRLEDLEVDRRIAQALGVQRAA